MKTRSYYHTERLLTACLTALSLAGSAHADFVFGKRVNLGPIVNSPQSDGWAHLSPDGLELYFTSNRPGGYGDYDIWMSRRASTEDPWGLPVNLGPGINSASYDYPSSLSSDGLTLYLFSPNAYWPDLFTATGPIRDAPWGPRVNMGPVINLPDISSTLHMNLDYNAVVSRDDLELFFASWRADAIGMADVYVTTRATPSDPWGPPVNLGPTINTSGRDFPLAISPDGLVLFIGSDARAGGFGGWDTWMTRRPYKGAAWSEPVNLGPSINTPRAELLTSISPDGKWAFVVDVTYNGTPVADADLAMVPILPIVDFNGDEIVDIEDLVMLIEHWGTDNTLYDIGPFAWGDGTVDANDLAVLMSYWGQEIPNPALIAHWRLDEAQGVVAADSAGGNDGILVGHPTWQPAGGKVGGALAFDGKDDVAVSGTSVLDPAAGPFSVIAWVKGGTPNGVIVSQVSAADWLYLNNDGMLATDLESSGRSGRSLASSAFIMDDQWHRVAFAWDGTNRALYVDSVEVAKDTQPNLAASGGDLNIGAGKNLVPATYWPGLIDDVRIYNRVVQP
jgi:hypothetical protein